jgi:hypothetical protein
MSAAQYFQQNPDVAQAYQVNNYGLTPEQFAQTHYELYGRNEQRAAPAAAPAVMPGTSTVVQPPAVMPGTSTVAPAQIPYFQQNPDVAASYKQNSYGMTPEQFAAFHFANYGKNEQRVIPTTSPFANATQGFVDNFNNYTSIPIGGQYNPAAVGGTGSPYSQIMAQMRPVGNPYMGVASGQPMGGYDPGIYDQGLLDRVRRENMPVTATGSLVDSGGSGGDSGSSSVGNGIGGNSTAGGMSNQGEGGPDGVGGWYNGGLIDRVTGNNPSTPDDGQINAQVGEYVVKKSSVNKYGKGLLDMINAGKIPAKKIKSLLD